MMAKMKLVTIAARQLLCSRTRATRAGDGSQHRRHEDALRARRAPERALQDDAAARERLGPHDEHQEDQHQRDELGQCPSPATSVCWLRKYVTSDCSMPMKSPPTTAGMHVLEAAEHRGGERRAR